tara:strand:+ start:2604 stop:3023 length:420 start_codon:yes stop_codon:yes gene_type:complete
MNGKGNKPRPTDLKKFRKNYENAFGKGITKAEIDKMSGVIKLESISSEVRQKRKIKVIKEYTDQNGVDMVIININGATANKVVTKNIYKTLEHDIVDTDRKYETFISSDGVKQDKDTAIQAAEINVAMTEDIIKQIEEL